MKVWPPSNEKACASPYFDSQSSKCACSVCMCVFNTSHCWAFYQSHTKPKSIISTKCWVVNLYNLPVTCSNHASCAYTHAHTNTRQWQGNIKFLRKLPTETCNLPCEVHEKDNRITSGDASRPEGSHKAVLSFQSKLLWCMQMLFWNQTPYLIATPHMTMDCEILW